jgi:hypothetical protein
VTDLASLERELGSALAGGAAWAERRDASLRQHHVHRDDASADRVAVLAMEMVRARWR